MMSAAPKPFLRRGLLLILLASLMACGGGGGDDSDGSQGDTGGGSGGDTSGGSGTLISSGVPVTGISGTEGSQHLYRIDVPSGSTKLTATTTGGTGDVDMYVRYGAPPEAGSFDCESENFDSEETCEADTPTVGAWYILLLGYEAHSGVTLNVTITAADAGAGPVATSCLDYDTTGQSPVVQTDVLMTLYRFPYDSSLSASAPNGYWPDDPLVEGPDGNFYGVTRYGGIDQYGYSADGIVFRLSPDGLFTKLHTFDYDGTRAVDGQNPAGGLTLGSDCSLYGTTIGGSSSGTVFRITLEGSISYLAEFDDIVTTGTEPSSKLVLGSDGNFYGTTTRGGAFVDNEFEEGTVFRMTPDGSLSTLVSLNESRGRQPVGDLIEGSDGYFYGVTQSGGAYSAGTIFKVSPVGDFTLLWSFQNATGEAPRAGLVDGKDGYFYGTTLTGGQYNGGTVYRINSQGQYTLLHSFNPVAVELGCNCGLSQPAGGLLLASDGNFYGTTVLGASGPGTDGNGSVFKMTPGGSVTPVAFFLKGDPGYVSSNLIQASTGHLYGTSSRGGTDERGTLFRVLPPSGSP